MEVSVVAKTRHLWHLHQLVEVQEILWTISWSIWKTRENERVQMPLQEIQNILKKHASVSAWILGDFFLWECHLFNVTTSHFYINMIRSTGSYSRDLKSPSMYDLRTWVLKEELNNIEKEIRRTWIQTNVTIMSDGCSDIKSRSMINILVNNPYGKIFLKSLEASYHVKVCTVPI